ncbi:MAG: sodium-translocating pyrophosphatase [Chloroflexi bacterium]|nr:sodium-translocating pyrophosphatase [Chloroflexota bacterium]
MMDPIVIAVIASVLGLGIAGFMASYVLRQEQGSERIREISAAIKEGALAFLVREYRILAIFVVVVGVILGVVPNLGWWVALSFVFGAICSGLAGYIGMSMAIRANSRTAAAAQKSLNQGLRVSFRSGTVMGMCVVGIGILGLSILYFAFNTNPDFLKIIPGFGFGASLVAIFARVGGGIYTKAADTGADIVGKVEKGIPEDDPRNAAVIADFVGDNVGDVAGMGADLFESYVDSIIATMTLGMIAMFSITLDKSLVPDMATAWFLPMMVAAGGIIASIIGVFLVRVGEKAEMGALLNALRRGTFSASIFTAIFAFIAVRLLNADIGIFWAILAGLIAGVLIGESTNYFTSYAYKPTLRIAEASQTGAGTLITGGFANGLMSTLPPVVLVAIAILVAHHFADIYGIAIAGVGMLSTLGIQDATDAYGPVADNAGGIVEMAGLPPQIRQRTDALDSLGNTTAATGKGFAIGSAALTALALMLAYALAYTQAAGMELNEFFTRISLLDAHVVVGLFLGAMLPAIFCAMTLNAVGKTSFSIINEVRRQFREIKGLMEGEARPEYGKCVDICTKASLKEMIAPGLMTVVAPIIIGFILGPFALGGFLLGAIASGFILAVTFANAGGSWDNAKKWIETGAFGGKGSDAHKAAVVGDTVGDPMKDTSGPSLNIMIKLMSIISLVLAPVLAGFPGLI